MRSGGSKSGSDALMPDDCDRCLAVREVRERSNQRYEQELPLGELDDFRARAFGSVTLGELDALAGMQFFKAYALKRRGMKEKVFARCGHDKSEAPVGQALDSSFSHLISPENGHEHGQSAGATRMSSLPEAVSNLRRRILAGFRGHACKSRQL
jgi:hypothetical protein